MLNIPELENDGKLLIDKRVSIQRLCTLNYINANSCPRIVPPRTIFHRRSFG